MAFKPKTKEYTSLEGNNQYTFQTVLPSVWAKIEDKITDKGGKLLLSVAMPEMLDKVVVAPSGLRLDDFESWAELEEVTMAAYKFQRQGK
ncbi:MULTISPECIES: hypothetical protein [Lysinibacillus]|uniref:hypothetical protein n=1 Tax=Lysinibacillus TaxID=400634 RepID=UPI00214B3806|nr:MULTISPECIES: hypothetical protein [Lysinibacillus]UUV27058.1 hypothetical protein NP781_11055 [Lysinibacillus sp. FN11]UYB45319.1 hypothetical protein OCI51_13710 [Lysinibacillus capsici]